MDKNKIIEAAAKLVAKGAYDKAIKEYQKVLEADPKDVRVLQKMGELYQKKNDNAQAAHFFTKVAESYSTDGFFLKAVALYKQVLKLNPNLLDVNLKLAELHQQLGLMSEAMAYFQIVANHYDKSGDIKNSLDTLKRMVDLDPENVASKIKLAELYARENMNKEASQEFARAAEYLKRNNRTEDWLRVAERLSAMEPENVALAKELAQQYLQRGDQKRSLAKLQVAFKADARDVETLNMLAQAFQGLGQTLKTVSVYKELAKVYQDTGRVQDANGIWERIQTLDPSDADLLARRSAAPAPQPAPPQPAPPQPPPGPPLRTTTQQFVQQQPPPQPPQPQPPPQYQQPAPPQPPPAQAQPPAAQQPGREQFSKLLTETDVYVKYGLHDKALEHLRKIFAVDPENLDAHEKAYQVYVASGNLPQASEQLLNVLRLCTRRVDVQRAQPYLATILQQNPGHPEVPAFLAVLRTDQTASMATAQVETVGEDAILVDSNDDEVFVAEAPEDALAQPPGDELALVTASSGDHQDEEVLAEDEPETTIISDDSLTGEATSMEGAFHASTEDDEGVVIADEPGSMGVEGDEPIFGDEFEQDEKTSVIRTSQLGLEAEPSADEALVDEPVEQPMGLGDEFDAPPTQVSAPSPRLLRNAIGEAPVLDEEGPTRVSTRPQALDEFETTSVGGEALPPEEDYAEPVSEPEPEAPMVEAEAPMAEAAPEEEAPPEEEAAPEEEPAAEECDEASFFIDQGVYDEAREILETVMIAFPGHARATELLAKLEAIESGGAPAEEAEPAEHTAPSVPTVQPVTEERDAFDLAAELADELSDFGGEPAPEPAAEDFQYSVEEVFAEFKKGLAKVVKPEDVDTHYDLGIAYREMGLIDDALHEFAVAREGCMGKKREVDCLTMIGLLQAQRGEPGAAVDTFKQALSSEHATGEVAKAIGFELAQAYEALGEAGKALYHFQRVAGMDPRYRDVSSNVERLAGTTAPEEDPVPGNAPAPVPAPPAAAAGGQRPRKVGYV
jgi:tetratricopeptide (TPR) repeat protein